MYTYTSHEGIRPAVWPSRPLVGTDTNGERKGKTASTCHHPEKPVYIYRTPRRPCPDQSHGQCGHGNGRQWRRIDRHIGCLTRPAVCAAGRRGTGVLYPWRRRRSTGRRRHGRYTGGSTNPSDPDCHGRIRGPRVIGSWWKITNRLRGIRYCKTNFQCVILETNRSYLINMQRHLLTCLFCCMTICTVWAQEICPIIPQPVSAEKGAGHFRLDKHTPIIAEDPLSVS